jgi:hypothetical protein
LGQVLHLLLVTSQSSHLLVILDRPARKKIANTLDTLTMCRHQPRGRSVSVAKPFGEGPGGIDDGGDQGKCANLPTRLSRVGHWLFPSVSVEQQHA